MLVGIENLVTNTRRAQSWGRCALVSNQASINQTFKPTWQILHEILGKNLVALFGPQHGFISTVQDNMIETDHAIHEPTGLPVYSLYSETREPTEEMLKGVDSIIVDLQHSGCRVYTYKYTMAACLRAAAKFQKRVVILDRPNPITATQVSGCVLDTQFRSFVGEFAIPLRHGLTMAELALLFNQEIGAECEVVLMKDYDPSQGWEEFKRPWVLPSPNLPIPDCIWTFPGLVMLEGTNISEGRGTCLPFLFVGSPYVKKAYQLIERIRQLYGALELDEALFLRETSFQPSFQKWSGKVCHGFQIHLLNRKALNSVKLGLSVIRSFIELYGNEFALKQPPYEYNYETLPLKLIVGSDDWVERLLSQDTPIDFNETIWHQGAREYIEKVSSILAYPRQLTIM